MNPYEEIKYLRIHVIDSCIEVETHISILLGAIIKIDWENSRTLGHKSGGLSFNQKVYMIQDIESISNEMVNKFTCLMRIRNKFAHVAAINTFERLFANTKVGKEVQKNLIKWYGDTFKKDNYKSEEQWYLRLFDLLQDELIGFLVDIQYEYHVKGFN
ncbi:hypothetical protein [Aquimarina sp. Aq107]|uniref:hypothetical protein n=1 Tax=Aquimarina sp. Aq107 TaxID=1191912 RepID=UPI000D55511F|nr:hypothetical protein [Aquimarina sp. Aq107]